MQRRRTMSRRFGKQNGFKVFVGSLLAAGSLVGTLPAGAQTPTALEPPDGSVESVRGYGVGFQIYVSTARADDPSKFVWTFWAPEATLHNNGGHVIAIHYKGPTWEAENGSKVVGAKIAGVPSPDPNSIPW